MISPEELRIDNWVCFDRSYYQVKGMLMSPSPQFYLYYKAGNEEEYINVQALHVSPIEITDDILVFNGFSEVIENNIRVDGEYEYEDEYVFMRYYLYSNNLYISIKNPWRDCCLLGGRGEFCVSQVHELQNILSMIPFGSKQQIRMYL